MDETTIQSKSAYIDDQGRVIIPLRGKPMEKRELNRHIQKCLESLPPLNGDFSIPKQELDKNRDILAYYTPCCDIWWRPVRHNYDYVSWSWHRVGKWRLMRWKRKGLL